MLWGKHWDYIKIYLERIQKEMARAYSLNKLFERMNMVIMPFLAFLDNFMKQWEKATRSPPMGEVSDIEETEDMENNQEGDLRDDAAYIYGMLVYSGGVCDK